MSASSMKCLEGFHCGITIKGNAERDALRPGIRLFLESRPPKVADLGSDFGLVGLQNTLAWQPSWSPLPIPRRTEHLCGITIKGKWKWDALRPDIRLFLESHSQKVADLGSDFVLFGL